MVPILAERNLFAVSTLSTFISPPSGSSFTTLPPVPRTPRAKRILVIDNEQASTRLVRLMLERCTNCEICEINDSTEAVVIALRFRPDLILLDVEMPGLDGGAVAANLQAKLPAPCVPIIFMTSLVTEDEAAHPMFTAGRRVLAKPVTAGKLVQCLGELLNIALSHGPSPEETRRPTRAIRPRTRKIPR